MFKLGAGAQLGLARNEFQIGAEANDDPLNFIEDGDSIESEFGLQNVKVYGIARGRVLGVHGGYMFDLGEDREFRSITRPIGPGGTDVTFNVPSSLSTSDGRDAIFFGADFDVPSDRIRPLRRARLLHAPGRRQRREHGV